MLPVLTTKLHIPHAHLGTVSRSRLIQKLNDGLWQTEGTVFSRLLTLITAPAGYGKTTLLSEWVGYLNIPVA
jgi:LuxR family transcriptional regulator, maltose regulon positive regulatory protein